MSLVPLAVVAAALLLVAIVYISVRSQPDLSDEGGLGTQPTPVETGT